MYFENSKIILFFYFFSNQYMFKEKSTIEVLLPNGNMFAKRKFHDRMDALEFLANAKHDAGVEYSIVTTDRVVFDK